MNLGEKETGAGIVVSSGGGINVLYGIVSVKLKEPTSFILVTNVTKHVPWIGETLATLFPVNRRSGK